MRFFLLALLLATPACFAAEEKKDIPRVTAVAPLGLTAGEASTLRLRGLLLKDATEVRTIPEAAAKLKDKKDASLPNGLEAKEVGDTEVSIELTPPADCTKLSVQIVTPKGATEPHDIAIFPKEATVAEKEPNDGFRTAQMIDTAKPIVGKIGADKDVDVFRFEAKAGKPITARLIAAGSGSLLDAVLSLYDAAGRSLGSADDFDTQRDPILTATPATDGPLCIVVSDAHDRGGSWHEYRLEISQP